MFPALLTHSKYIHHCCWSPPNIYHNHSKYLPQKSHLFCHIYQCFQSINCSHCFSQTLHSHSQHLTSHSLQISTLIYLFFFTVVASPSCIPKSHTSSDTYITSWINLADTYTNMFFHFELNNIDTDYLMCNKISAPYWKHLHNI